MDSKINNIKDILACALMFIKRNNSNINNTNSNSSFIGQTGKNEKLLSQS